MQHPRQFAADRRSLVRDAGLRHWHIVSADHPDVTINGYRLPRAKVVQRLAVVVFADFRVRHAGQHGVSQPTAIDLLRSR